MIALDGDQGVPGQLRAAGSAGPVLFVLAAVAGAGVAAAPRVLLAAVLTPLALVLLTAWPAARLLWFVAGGLLVFQSGIDLAKIVYIAGCAFGVGVILSQGRSRATGEFRVPRWAIAALLAVLAGSMLVSFGAGTPLRDGLRDALPYLMLAIAPLVAEDAGRNLQPTAIRFGIGAAGVVAAAGFVVALLGRRSVSTLDLERVTLTTTVVPALGFAFAITYAFFGTRRWMWALLAALIPAALVMTGTRTNLVLFIGLVGLAGSARRFRVRVCQLAACSVALLVAAGAVVWALAPVLIKRQDFLAYRLQILMAVLTKGGAADSGSYQARLEDYQWAAEAWSQHPLLGTGAGFRYPNGSFTLDSPLITLAKFGLIGTLVIIVFLYALYRSLIRTASVHGWSPVHTALRCFAIIVVFLVPFGSPLEDKGLSLSIGLASAALIADVAFRRKNPELVGLAEQASIRSNFVSAAGHRRQRARSPGGMHAL